MNDMMSADFTSTMGKLLNRTCIYRHRDHTGLSIKVTIDVLSKGHVQVKDLLGRFIQDGTLAKHGFQQGIDNLPPKSGK